ncbi:UBX domain-containing protein 10 [Podospora pseudopauciseta]|uniref:UBX domain-containing protein 10 n=1 Tax=Podospora pseudopauciseta TaxID=2093780 RepID=A0ABR0I267_9PEZI|nr:UBX domain-containing protein 10 [Podospora pseudopauciseta]
MADGVEFDLGQLSSQQQEALQQYTDVTGQEIKDAVPLLERSQWNVQIAIAKFFDGDGPDLVAEAQAAQDNPRPAAARYENLHESFLDADDDRPRRTRSPRTEAAPRVVPQQPVSIRPRGLLSILLAPFSTTWSLTRGVLGVFGRIISFFFAFLPASFRPRYLGTTIRGLGQAHGRTATLPQEAARRFRREFEEAYGTHGLVFFEGGHAQALDTAKRDLKFFLMVLISPEHDDTDSFIRNTLLSPDVVSYISDPSNNIILWGGNVADPEAHQVANEYSCLKYPFSCLVCLTPKEGSTRMGIVKRLVGPMTPAAYLSGLQDAITKYSPDLNGVRAERAAQEHARNLRNEQDSAYERSLARDRERARQKREAEAAAAAAEKRALEEAERAARQEELRRQWRIWRATTVAPEPDTKDAVRLALNMPASAGGGRVIRRFASDTTLEELYAFVECYGLLQEGPLNEKATEPEGYEHKYGFQVASVLPRETFHPSKTITIGQKMGRGGSLVVEDLIDEEEEE